MRTSNMPAGLKRYWQGRSRKKSHHKSTALVRHSSSPVVRYKTRTKTIVRRSKGGGTKHAHGAGEMIPGPFRIKSMAISSLVGYSESGKGFAGLQELLVKVPKIGNAPKEAIVGAVLNYFADKSPWLDAAAQAFLDIGGYKVGLAGYSVSGDDDD